MFQFLSRYSLPVICMVTLAACASTPKSSTLMTGISPIESSKTFPDGQIRLATDPVCETFYANTKTFISDSKNPSRGTSFLSSLGVSVLSGVVAAQVPTAGISSTLGRIAARRAASSVITQGGRMTANEVKKSSAPGVKIAKAAEELNCPISFAP